MKVPKVIEVGSHEFTLLFDEVQDDKAFRGALLLRKQIMLLNPHLHPQQLRVSLLHEILHVAEEMTDLDLGEANVWRLAEILGDVLFRCFGLDFDFSEIEVLDRYGKRKREV